MKLGRLPFAVSASSVNWLTTSTAPPTSSTERSKRPSLVGEDPQPRHLRRQPLRVGLAVASGHAEQDEQANADLPDDRPVHAHGCPGDALDHRPHVDPHYGRYTGRGSCVDSAHSACGPARSGSGAPAARRAPPPRRRHHRRAARCRARAEGGRGRPARRDPAPLQHRHRCRDRPCARRAVRPGVPRAGAPGPRPDRDRPAARERRAAPVRAPDRLRRGRRRDRGRHRSHRRDGVRRPPPRARPADPLRGRLGLRPRADARPRLPREPGSGDGSRRDSGG